MKQLETMKESLMSCVMYQMNDLKNTDTNELGEVIDMIKDLSEAIYYDTITEAMKEPYGNEEYERHYYTKPRQEWKDDATSRYDNHMVHSNERSHQEPMMAKHDPKEGRSYLSRKTYLEAKEKGHDKTSNLQDLEHYMMELSQDITEMIDSATTEEKQLLHKKLSVLAQKIATAANG